MRTDVWVRRMRRRSREIEALAALGLVVLLALLSVSGGCRDTAAAATGAGYAGVSRPLWRRPPLLKPWLPVGVVSPSGAAPLSPGPWRSPRESAASTVPAGATLRAAGSHVAALLDTTGGLGRERILVCRPGRPPAMVVDGARGAGRRMAITGLAVSDGWLVWEEASQYDLELGGAARWRLHAAPLIDGTGRLGAERVVDEGVVAKRPRCDFAVSDGRLVVASTRATGVLRPPRAAVELIELATGARRVLCQATGCADSVSWQGDRIAATFTGTTRARRAGVAVFDGTGLLLGRVVLADGWTFGGRAAARGDVVAASVCRAGQADGRLLLFSIRGRALGVGPRVEGGPQWAGDRVVALASGPPAAPEAFRLVCVDPAGARIHPLGYPAGVGHQALVPVLSVGTGGARGSVVVGLEPLEPGDTASARSSVRWWTLP